MIQTMLIQIDEQYKNEKVNLRINDIVYKAFRYNWEHNPITFEIDFNNEYKILDIKEVIKNIWYNYELQNIYTKEIILQQTCACLYKKDVINNILHLNRKQLSIFDFL